MSRWSAEPLRISLAPGEAALLRARGNPASQVLTTQERNATSLLPLLDKALADPAWHGQRVEVVLSQHFVRHVLTPPPGKALSRNEEHALVAASFREIYGDEAGRWRIRVLSQPPQYGLLGAAIDESLLQQLDALLARHGFRDITIHPLASLAAHRLPKRFSGWWALAEPGWVSLFGGAKGFWHHVSGQPVDPDWMAALPGLIELESEATASGLSSDVWVQAVGAGPVAAPVATRERWHVLPHDGAVQGALALAKV